MNQQTSGNDQATSNSQKNSERSEGTVASMIENETSKLPSDLFLCAAVTSMGLSLIFKLSGSEDNSRFVGQWVAPFLLFGVYNKIVKVAGSDRTENRI